MEAESVDVMHYVWSGKWPANKAPKLDSMKLKELTAHDEFKLSLVKRANYPRQSNLNHNKVGDCIENAFGIYNL